MGGFTIVESMLVLTVSSVLFVSMAALVYGQQQKMQFRSTMDGVTTRLKAQITQVNDGYYPAPSNYSCTVGADGAPVVVESGGNTLGTNKDCIFAGRAVTFGRNGDDTYLIHQTLVGARSVSSGAGDKTDYDAKVSELKLRAMAPGTKTNLDWPDFSSTYEVPFGARLEYAEAIDASGGRAPIAGFAILTPADGQVGDAAGGPGGSVGSRIVPMLCMNIKVDNWDDFAGIIGCLSNSATSSAVSSDLVVTAFNSEAKLSEAVGLNTVRLCFRSGTTEQSALVTVGASGGNESIEQTIYNDVKCGRP